MPAPLNLADQKFGHLTALHRLPSQGGHVMWLCLCDCGCETRVGAGTLKSGHTKSCGCAMRELCKAGNTRHGQSGSNRTPEYMAWISLQERCTNPNRREWHRYGGRGIQVRFGSFEEFFAEIGPRPSPQHSVDRIDNEAHYGAGNVRWATKKEQDRNKSTNRFLTYQGRTQCLTDWAKELGFSLGCLQARLRKDWSVERAFSQPLRYTSRRSPNNEA